MNQQRLGREFYERPAEIVAKELLGAHLVKNGRVGKIVETEAYVGEHDLACHAAKGRTPRTEVMYGPGGFSYVYFIYGLHWLFNVVSGEWGSAAAVLIRALEPMGEMDGPTNGPAKFTKTLSITGKDSAIDLVTSPGITITSGVAQDLDILTTPRINVAYSGAWAAEPLRFYIKDNPYVSRP